VSGEGELARQGVLMMTHTTRRRCLAALALLLLGSPAAYGEKAPFALQLTDSTFNGTMASASSSTYVLVEFFASWCVRCERPQFAVDGTGTRGCERTVMCHGCMLQLPIV